jgi:hypothetical protein
MKYITRQKIYDCRFWKEECFWIDRCRRLRTCRFFPQMHRRQSTAHQIPSLDPGDELIQEFISQDHFKYEWKRVYIDEFKHELLTSTANSCGIALPRLPFREALQQEGIFARPAEANRLERSRPRGRRRLKEKADGRRPRLGPVDQQQKVQKQTFGTLLKHNDKESRLSNNTRKDESTPLSNRPIGSRRKKARTNTVVNGEPSLD